MMSCTCVCLGLVGVVCLLLYWLTVKNYGYWRKRGVPYRKPVPFFGNIANTFLQKQMVGEIYKEIYEEFDGYSYCGAFRMRQPVLLLRDPELVKEVTIKNFASFHDNDVVINEKTDPLFAKNPFCLKGERWKMVRGQITPSFTAGKIKQMFPLMEEVTKQMLKYIETSPEAKASGGVDTKELCSKYTTDVVAYCAFGIDAKSFVEPDPIFRKMGREIMGVTGFWDGIMATVIMEIPMLANLFSIKFIKTHHADFFKNIVKETTEHRKMEGIVKNDFIDSMINLREKITDYDFNLEHMAAQALTFVIDGYETSSGVFSFMLYELAANRDIFERLRDEVDTVLDSHGGKITYDAVQDMPFLDCVLSETIRKYPPGTVLGRTCTQDFEFPNPKGPDAGSPVKIKKGMVVMLPVLALHRDPKYFPNPEKFDPDRFSEENKHNIIKGAFLPFGEGPRQCIGLRFATAQIKAAVVSIVKNFEMSVNPKTIEPLEIDPNYFLLAPKGGIWLDFQKRKSN